jgi:hypothetical protein
MLSCFQHFIVTKARRTSALMHVSCSFGRAPGRSRAKGLQALLPRRATASKRARTAGGGRGGGTAGGGSSTITAPKPVTYADLGGIEAVLDAIKELIEYPLKHPEVCDVWW